MTYLKRGELAKAADISIEVILFIRCCQNLGFTRKKIFFLQNLKIEPDQQCGHVKENVDTRFKELDLKIRDLKAIRTVLRTLNNMCIPELSNHSSHFQKLIEEVVS